MTNKQTKYVITFLSVVSSIAGFIFTGICAYPYGIHWDSGWIFSHIYNDEHLYINNWMGWYYPNLWALLYKTTGIPHIVGVLQNILYWSSLLSIFLVKCKKTWKSYIAYLIFAYFPLNLLFITNITNNALLYSFLLLSLSLYLISNYYNKRYLFLSLFFLLNCIFIRRDAFFIVIPITILILYIQFCNWMSYKKAFFMATTYVILTICFITTIEHLVTDKKYQKVNSIQLIAIVDFTGMSYQQDSCYWPANIISSDYTPEKVLTKLNMTSNIYDDITTFYNYGLNDCLKTKYFLNPNMHNFIPIYLSNLREYIIWKYSMIQHILTNSKAILFDCHGMNGINYPYNGPKLLHNKIAYWLPKILNTGLLYLAIITLLILCDINGFIFYTNPTTKFFSRSIVLLCLLSIVMTLICQTSVQIRYIVPYILIILGVYTYNLGNNKTVST